MKKVQADQVKLQIAGRQGHARAAGRAGARPARRQHHGLLQAFNARTAKDEGLIIPVVVTVYADRSYTFITKTPPAAVLLKRAAEHRQGHRPSRTRPRSAR